MKIIFLLVMLLPVYLTNAQELDGSYILIAAQYGNDISTGDQLYTSKAVKLFKQGYWLAAFFGNVKQPFDGAGGGTYVTKGNKYLETLRFYSWDSTAKGKTYDFDFQIKGDHYFQSGVINSDKYKDYIIKEESVKLKGICPLVDNYLEGVWFLQEVKYKNNTDLPEQVEQMKIYAYPRFAWARYNKVNGSFLGAGGGSYSFDGKKLIEHIEYITHDLALGTDLEIDVSKQGSTIKQSSFNGNNIEIWKRAK